MSVDGEGSNDQKPQQQQQQQQLNAQDLNFSLNDILSHNHHDVNDSSFQSIVQTLSNTNEHITPSYAHLPAELQDLFSNETDDLLSTQDSHSDASLLHGDMAHMWQQQPFLNANNKPVSSSPVQQPPSSSTSSSSSTTLLDNITSKLPPERKDRFIQLFRELQSSNVSAENFLNQAKSLLGEQQYQQLEDLKNKPIQKRTLTSSQIRAEDAQRSMPGVNHTPQLKRAKTEHIPLPLQQQPMQFPPPTMQQQQQQQMQHLQMSLQQQHLQMLQQQQQQQQPVIPVTPQQQSTPVFKTPAVPTTPGLQIPTKTTHITSKPAPTSTPTASSSSGGGGDSRIDYEALTDVMGYTGVDLKEESELFMSNTDTIGGALPDGVDVSKVQDFMNGDMLKTRILKYAKCVDIKEIDSDFVSYLALAAQDRIRTVMESMVLASKHRTWSPFKKPPDGHAMFKIQVKQNVKLQLEAIQRVSRQTELDLDPEEEKDQDVEMSHEKGWYSNRSRKPMVPSVEEKRKITVQDAIFVMERDVQGGRGSNQKALLRAYNEYLT